MRPSNPYAEPSTLSQSVGDAQIPLEELRLRLSPSANPTQPRLVSARVHANRSPASSAWARASSKKATAAVMSPRTNSTRPIVTFAMDSTVGARPPTIASAARRGSSAPSRSGGL